MLLAFTVFVNFNVKLILKQTLAPGFNVLYLYKSVETKNLSLM